jgi:hypothetical protein
MSLTASGHLYLKGVRLGAVDSYLALPGCLAVFDPRQGFTLKSGRFATLSNLVSPANSLYAPIPSNGPLAVTDASTFGSVTASRQAAQYTGSTTLAQTTLQLSQLHKAAATIYTVLRVSSALGAASTIWGTNGSGTPGLALSMNTVNCNLVYQGFGSGGNSLFTQIVRSYAYFVGDVIMVVQRLTGPTTNTAACTASGSTNTSTKTFIVVSPLPAAIAPGSILVFTTGTVVTVSAAGAAAGATSIPLVGTIGATIANATQAGVGQAILTTYAPTTNVTITTNAAAAASATSIAIQPLGVALWTGYVAPFPGVNATLSAPAAVGATSLSVTALSGSIASGAVATRIHGGVLTSYGSRVMTSPGNVLDQADSVAYKLLGGSGNNNVLLQTCFTDAGLNSAQLLARDARMADLLRADFAAYQLSGLI